MTTTYAMVLKDSIHEINLLQLGWVCTDFYTKDSKVWRHYEPVLVNDPVAKASALVQSNNDS